MKIQILLFATLKDIIKTGKLTFELEDTTQTLQKVRAELIRTYPEAEENLNSAIASINEEYAFNEDMVKDGDTIAFFPPVSGGSSGLSTLPEIYFLSDTPINHDEIVEQVTTPETGAVCIFSGIVRGKTDKDGHIPVTEYLYYEAYEKMATAKMRQVISEIRVKWPEVFGIAIIQRIGKLEVGQNTILIACSSAHRDSGCFEAARYGIDRLKEIVPVWKKEFGADGSTWIEGDYTPHPKDRSD